MVWLQKHGEFRECKHAAYLHKRDKYAVWVPVVVYNLVEDVETDLYLVIRLPKDI